jgi:hypothetical protein
MEWVVTSPHDRYRAHLAVLADDDAVLEAAGVVRRGAPQAWTRRFGRFHPGRPCYAQLVFANAADARSLITIDVFEQGPTSPPEGARRTSVGGMRVTRFPCDARLTTLSRVLDEAPDATVVRYRPGQRCTLRLRVGGRDCFAKVFPDDAGARLFAEGVALWQAGERGELGFAVAEPVGWHAGLRMLTHAALAGGSAIPAISSATASTFVRALGRAAATMPRSHVQPTHVFDAEEQLRRTASYARDLADRVPALAADADRFVARLRDAHGRRPLRALRPIHGSPHIHQWIDMGERVGLVDFDRFSMGDPELDVATFLGELDFEDGLAVPATELGEHFMAGYEDVDGRLDRPLVALYRAHKRLAKVLRSAWALRVDGHHRAQAHFARAVRLADEELAA